MRNFKIFCNIYCGIRGIFTTHNYAVANALLNNSCTRQQRAVANGLAQAISNCVNVIGLIVMCNIFSYVVTETNWSRPFNLGLVFFIQASGYAFNALQLSFSLPKDFENVIAMTESIKQEKKVKNENSSQIKIMDPKQHVKYSTFDCSQQNHETPKTVAV